MKSLNQKFTTAYVALLSLQVPFNIAFFLFLLRGMSVGTLQLSGKETAILYLLIAIFYFLAVGILGILNIVKSFQAFRQSNEEQCLKAMLIMKYGMVPFFIVNFLSITALLIIALMGSRGTIIFAFPVVIGLLLFASFCTWLAMIPGAFYSIQVIRFGRLEGKITSGWAIWHILLQFIFLTDVLDTIYLIVRKWNRGKVGAVIICGIYLLVIGWGIMTLCGR